MPNAFGFGGYGGAPVQVQVQGSDPAVVDRLASAVAKQISAVPGAVGLDNSNDNLQTQLRAKIDWTRAADLGVNPRDAGTALRSALDGFTSNANQFRVSGRPSIPIRILTVDPTNTTPSDIERLPVTGARGGIQLGQFATLEQTRIPTSITHVNRLRSVMIGVSAGQGHLVGDLQNGVQAAVASVPMPPGYAVTYAGQGQQRRQCVWRPRARHGHGRAADVHADDDVVRLAHAAACGAHVVAVGDGWGARRHGFGS
jgi:multidrug efflux pump subunit AcrB